MEPTKMTWDEKRLAIIKKKQQAVEDSADAKRFKSAMRSISEARITLKGKFYKNTNGLEADEICNTLDMILTARKEAPAK